MRRLLPPASARRKQPNESPNLLRTNVGPHMLEPLVADPGVRAYPMLLAHEEPPFWLMEVPGLTI